MRRLKWKRPVDDEVWVWRHELAPPAEPSPFGANEVGLNRAWRQLVLIHSSFRATEQAEYRDLVRGLREIERLFLDRPELGAYYDECHQPPGKPPTAETLPARSHRHIAAIQAQFMEDVYFVLQLSRYANALDNRGWMNLFRSWGQSPTFNAAFDGLRATFAEEFIGFYELYVRRCPGPIDTHPVRHPWDAGQLDPEFRGVSGQSALSTPEGTFTPGVFLDAGIQPAQMRSPGARSRGIKDDGNDATIRAGTGAMNPGKGDDGPLKKGGDDAMNT